MVINYQNLWSIFNLFQFKVLVSFLRIQKIKETLLDKKNSYITKSAAAVLHVFIHLENLS